VCTATHIVVEPYYLVALSSAGQRYAIPFRRYRHGRRDRLVGPATWAGSLRQCAVAADGGVSPRSTYEKPCKDTFTTLRSRIPTRNTHKALYQRALPILALGSLKGHRGVRAARMAPFAAQLSAHPTTMDLTPLPSVHASSRHPLRPCIWVSTHLTAS
jgi:hypothetical protein